MATWKITITKVSDKKVIETGQYTVIEKRPYSKEELKDSGDPEYYKKQLKEIRGYTPEREIVIAKEIEIYKQIVENLDLVEVIDAVNGVVK